MQFKVTATCLASSLPLKGVFRARGYGFSGYEMLDQKWIIKISKTEANSRNLREGLYTWGYSLQDLAGAKLIEGPGPWIGLGIPIENSLECLYRLMSEE
jgi:hypothetical protein